MNSDKTRTIFKYSRKNTVVKEMPPFDLEKMRKEDEELENEDVPFRFGKGFDVAYSFSDGKWEDVEGGRLWTISFKSKKALSLNYIFEDFYLPEGASLYIESQDETILYGPVTIKDLSKKHDTFLTDIIPGDQSTIYLFEPLEKRGESKLTIKRVVHGYRGIVFDENYGTVGSSSSCNHDVACLPAYEKESNAVALVLLSDGNELCSGSLLVNTNLTFDPYFLTAFHCIDRPNNDNYLSDSEKSAAENWMFKFCFKKASCNGSNLVTDYTYNKADFCSAWYTTDFALMKLKGTVSQNKNLTWLGWERTGNTPSSTTCIHHPAGDVMKISTDDDAATSTSRNSGINNFWQVDFDYGITQGGSSGSPLLNQYNRVVGQLQGGPHLTDTCDWTIKYYGKFNLSWAGGGHDYDRLSNWLDPVGTGQTTMDSSHPISIFGPVAPCNSDVYSVTNLPSGYNVIWSWHPAMNPLSNLEGTMGKKGLPLDSNLVFPPFPPIIEGITLMQNTPAANQCTIVIPSGTNALGTLKATIKKNGTTICVLEKNLDSSSGFYGTYTRTHVGSPTIGPNQFSSGSTIIANYGDVVTLQSPYFIDANISKTSTIPLSWTNNNGTISFTIPMNSQGGNSAATISFSGTNEDYCMSFGFTIYVNATDQLMAPTPDYELQVESEGQSYSFSMVPIEECKSDNLLNNPAISWELTIVNTNTGQIVYNRETTGSTLTINTESWKEGIYAARAVIGDDVITKKITYIIK